MRNINKKDKFMKEILKLWCQHSEWTLMAITSIVFNNPNEEAVLNRLLRNPDDFYLVLEPFYEENIASRFSNLLTEHLVLAGDLAYALMNEPDMVADIRRRWYQNADEISYLLGLINPYWTYRKWREMFFKHLQLAERFTIALLDRRYDEYVMVYDMFEAQTMMMADMMYEGIMKQFPDKFK